jgi:hypothetical protein
MYFYFSLIPATLAVALGYFILFSSARSQGGVRTFGRILAIWVLVLAALFPLAGGYATYAGLPPVADMMRSMHSGAASQRP